MLDIKFVRENTEIVKQNDSADDGSRDCRQGNGH